MRRFGMNIPVDPSPSHVMRTAGPVRTRGYSYERVGLTEHANKSEVNLSRASREVSVPCFRRALASLTTARRRSDSHKRAPG